MKISRLALHIALGTALALGATAARAAVTAATLTAVPASSSGPCPFTFHFKGTITTDRQERVAYKFRRSDGAIDTITKYLSAPGPGVHPIADETWTLGGPGFSYAGWEQIEILEPTPGFLSNEAAFKLACPGKPQQPTRTPTHTPTHPSTQGKPDLVIREFFIGGEGPCNPNSILFVLKALVANIGTANAGATTVIAKDQHPGVTWAGSGPVPALAPGGSIVVSIGIPFLTSNPAHMTAFPTHPFKATVDPANVVAESNELNNDSAILNVPAPKGCPPAGSQPPGAAPN